MHGARTVNEPFRFGIDDWDQSYAGSSMLWGDPVPFVAEESQRWLDPARPGLEVPCGDGRNTSVLARHFEALTAVDSSERALGQAIERGRSANLQNVRFLAGNIYELPFHDGEFGSVVCWDLLAHLEDAEGALKEVARVSEPNGSIIFNVYSRDDSTLGDGMVELRPNEYVYDDTFYYHYYSRDEVEELISRVDSVAAVEIETSRWIEGPHRGYREYEHEHESWVAVLRKKKLA